MNIEHLKIVMDTIGNVANGAASVAITYFVVNALLPIAQYSIIGYVVVKCVDKITSMFAIDTNKKNETRPRLET